MPIDARTAILTLEMLAAPQFCRRSCRRARQCLWDNVENGLPSCLGDLDEHQRQCFDELYHLAELADDPDALAAAGDTADPQTRSLKQAAVAISRAGFGNWSQWPLSALARKMETIDVPGAEAPRAPCRRRRQGRHSRHRGAGRDAG